MSSIGWLVVVRLHRELERRIRFWSSTTWRSYWLTFCVQLIFTVYVAKDLTNLPNVNDYYLMCLRHRESFRAFFFIFLKVFYIFCVTPRTPRMRWATERQHEDDKTYIHYTPIEYKQPFEHPFAAGWFSQFFWFFSSSSSLAAAACGVCSSKWVICVHNGN